MNGYFKQEQKYRTALAHAWVAMSILVLSMYAVDLLSAAVENDFSRFAGDPGFGGLLVMGFLFSLYAFVPLLVRELDWLSFRWFVCICTVYVTCFFLVHQISHIVKSPEFSVRYIVDINHHFMGVWASYLAVRWLRCGVVSKQRASADLIEQD